MDKLKILFMGTPEFGATILRALANAPEFEVVGVVTQPDRPVGRKNVLTPPAVKVTAQELGLPVMQVEKLRDPAVLEQLREFSRGADIFVIAAFGMILPGAVLEMPRLQCINVHGSLLPEYRGASPVAQAILDGKTETGVTIMLMEKGLDTGPMLSKAVVPIAPAETQPTLMAKVAEAGAKLLLETLPRWAAGELIPEKQDDSKATFTGIIKKEFGLIDWQQSAAYIERMTRAYDPWPGVFTIWQGQTLKILKAKALINERVQGIGPREDSESDSQAMAGTALLGQVIGEKGDTLVIATGQGWLAPLELQLPGKKLVSVEDFLRGQRAIIRARLG